MASAAFFSTSGGTTSLEDPEVCAAPAIPVVKVIASGIMSTVVSQVSTIIVTALQKRQFVFAEKWSEEAIRKRIQLWKLLDVVVGLLLISYLAFSILFVLLFLANVSDIDRLMWVLSATITFINSWLLCPFITSCILVALLNLRSVKFLEGFWVETALNLTSFTSEVANEFCGGTNLDKKEEEQNNENEDGCNQIQGKDEETGNDTEKDEENRNQNREDKNQKGEKDNRYKEQDKHKSTEPIDWTTIEEPSNLEATSNHPRPVVERTVVDQWRREASTHSDVSNHDQGADNQHELYKEVCHQLVSAASTTAAARDTDISITSTYL